MSLDWQEGFGPCWPLFKSLDLLLSSGNREPLKFLEHRSDSITFVLEGSQAVGLKLAPCICCELPERKGLLDTFAVSPAPLCSWCELMEGGLVRTQGSVCLELPFCCRWSFAAVLSMLSLQGSWVPSKRRS